MEINGIIDVLLPLVGWLIEGVEETPLTTGKWWYMVHQTGPSIFTKRTFLNGILRHEWDNTGKWSPEKHGMLCNVWLPENMMGISAAKHGEKLFNSMINPHLVQQLKIEMSNTSRLDIYASEKNIESQINQNLDQSQNNEICDMNDISPKKYGDDVAPNDQPVDQYQPVLWVQWIDVREQMLWKITMLNRSMNYFYAPFSIANCKRLPVGSFFHIQIAWGFLQMFPSSLEWDNIIRINPTILWGKLCPFRSKKHMV